MIPKLAHDEVRDRIVDYVNGRLTTAERETFSAHLAGCPTCAALLDEWQTIRSAVQTTPLPLPSPATLNLIRARIQSERSTEPVPTLPRRRSTLAPSFLLDLLIGQIPLVRQQIWSASALVMLIGLALALTPYSRGGTELALVAPLVAAVGVGFIYGADNDPPLELTLATPTSPRLILLARLTLVCGYDFGLAFAGSAALVVFGHAPAGFLALVGRWLGSMLLLAAVSLWLSLRLGSMASLSGAAGLWVSEVFFMHRMDHLLPAVALALTTTNFYSVGIAAMLVTFVFIRLPQQEQFA